MRRIGKLALIGIVFLVAFFFTTITFDWLCWHTGYYDQAVKDSAEVG